MIKEIFLNFGIIFCDFMSTAIFIQILLSWVVLPDNRMYLILDSVTAPIMKISRKVTPKVGMIDFSPVIALLALEILKSLWIYVFSNF